MTDDDRPTFLGAPTPPSLVHDYLDRKNIGNADTFAERVGLEPCDHDGPRSIDADTYEENTPPDGPAYRLDPTARFTIDDGSIDFSALRESHIKAFVDQAMRDMRIVDAVRYTSLLSHDAHTGDDMTRMTLEFDEIEAIAASLRTPPWHSLSTRIGRLSPTTCSACTCTPRNSTVSTDAARARRCA